MGGCFKGIVYILHIPLGYINYTIVHLKILNIVLALKVWTENWRDKIIDLKCDNMAVVEVLRSGKAKDGILAMTARNIWLLTSLFNIQLMVNHIPGMHNETADLLSRWKGTATQCTALSTLVPHYK